MDVIKSKGLLDTVICIWSVVLKQDATELHPDTHFLLQGGDSLQLARILARIRAELGVNLPLGELSSFSTPRKMACCCEASLLRVSPLGQSCGEKTDAGTVLQGGAAELLYPATGMQQGLWYAEQLGAIGSLYSNAVLIHFSGSLQVPLLRKSVCALFARFPLLGSRFQLDIRNRVLSGVLPGTGEEGAWRDLEVISCNNVELYSRVKKILAQPCNFAEGGLFRCVLFITAEQQCHLLLCCHHLICDGWSGGLLLQTLASCYSILLDSDCEPVIKADTAFRDYALRERASCSAVNGQDIAWWRGQLAGAELAQQWIWQRNMAASWPHRVQHTRLGIPASVLEDCKRNARQTNVSLFTYMQLACKLALQRFSGVDDQVLGIPVTERELQEESSVGCYLRMLVARTCFTGASTFAELLEQEAKFFQSARQRLIPLNLLARELQPCLLPDGNAWFSVLFAYQNYPEHTCMWNGLDVTVETVHPCLGQFALKFEILPGCNSWLLQLEYAQGLFSQQQVHELGMLFLSILEHQPLHQLVPATGTYW